MCDSATPPAPSYLDLEMTVADLRAQLAAANEARETAEKERDEARDALGKACALAMIPLQRGEHFRDVPDTQPHAAIARIREDLNECRIERDAAEARAAEAEKERDLLRERLDQFEAYAITVVSALDDRAAREKAERERDAYRHEWNVSSRQQGAETRKRHAAESSLARAEAALRHCARELQCIADDERCDKLHQTGEGRACIALAESVLGPMRDWPEEPNASGVLARAYFAGGGK